MLHRLRALLAAGAIYWAVQVAPRLRRIQTRTARMVITRVQSWKRRARALRREAPEVGRGLGRQVLSDAAALLAAWRRTRSALALIGSAAGETLARRFGPWTRPVRRWLLASWAPVARQVAPVWRALSRRLHLRAAAAWLTPRLARWGWVAAALVILAVFLLQPSPRAPRIPGTAPRALAAAYPDVIGNFRDSELGWVAVLRDGTELIYSDRQRLDFDRRVLQADLASVLSQPYPFGPVPLPAPKGQEPGRIRNYLLLGWAYGATSAEVQARLEAVDFVGASVLFNRGNGAADALRAVAAEISADPELLAYVRPIAAVGRRRVHSGPLAGHWRAACISGWNWREIDATRRLSAHSYGIALDLNNPFTTLPKYWLWARRSGAAGSGLAIEQVPWRLIEAFERHGFIWGGKWHHFDTMHFEYRPEFLALDRLAPRLAAPARKSACQGAGDQAK